MKPLSKNALIGYPAGVITGIAYGLNPLFAMPLMNDGASVDSVLFFRYAIAVGLLAVLLLCERQSFKVTPKQIGVLFALGTMFTLSSIFLFEAFKYIPSGLATTLCFLFPVFVALTMVFLKVVPSWQVWLAIAVTFIGVTFMSIGDSSGTINLIGVLLSLASALTYAWFIVIINKSKAISSMSNRLLTFYALVFGAIIFFVKLIISGADITTGIDTGLDWFNLVCLAIFPTIISTATLAVATRNIGATKASILEVFEPITAIVVGTLVFGEPLTNNIIIGLTISIAAVVFMIVTTKR